VGGIQTPLSLFHDNREPMLGGTQVSGPGGLGYHHFGVVVEGGV